jgi:Tfp pilus assembly protein PilX
MSRKNSNQNALLTRRGPTPSRSTRRLTGRRRRSGVAAVLALMLLMVLVALAVGMANSTAGSMKQSSNCAAMQVAQLQAESGLDYMIYLMKGMSLAKSATNQDILNSIKTTLGKRLDHTAALNQGAVVFDPTNVQDPNTLRIQSVTAGGTGFFDVQVTIPQKKQIALAVTGHSGMVVRTVSILFDLTSSGSTVFPVTAGITSRGPIKATGNFTVTSTGNRLDASICSATYSQAQAVKITGNANIAGEVFISNPAGQASLTGNASIGGATGSGASQHIHVGAGDPNIPEVNPAVFQPLATNHMTASTPTTGNNTYDNLYIPANRNPTFTGNSQLRGVTYIEKPNKVTFAGNCTIAGVIVTQDAGDNNYDTNTIKFTGNTYFNDVSTLPDLPQFAQIKQMPGSSLLAPGFGVTMTGNFGTVAGWIAADKFTFTGNVTGTIRGGIINYGDTQFLTTGNATLIFDRNDASNHPSGFTVPPAPATLTLKSDSYKEGYYP